MNAPRCRLPPRRCHAGAIARSFALILLLAIGAGPWCGCQAPRETAKSGVRFKNWWNFYERALRLQEQQAFDEARLHFEIALGLSPGATYGADRDIWRARTYGLHFVEGYFPHREMGICLYHLGRDAEAEQQLARSLAQTPSGRAKHYLNLVRARRLSTAPADPPRIVVDGGESPMWSNARAITLRGVAAAAARVKSIRIGGRDEFIELAEAERRFERAVPLREGENQIAVAVADLLGRRTERQVRVTADWTPPTIAVLRTRKTAHLEEVEVLVEDDRGVASIFENGEAVPSAGARAARAVPHTLRIAGPQPVRLVVRDLAGNEIAAEFTRDGLARALRTPGPLLAEVATDAVADVQTPRESRDRMKPALRLRAVRPEIVVFADEFYMDGEAADGGGVSAVEVNGENLLPEGARGARICFFARRVPLEPGTNTFEVVARDTAGNALERQLTVIRRAPDYMDEAYRLSLGITPAVYAGERADAALIQQLLREAVLADPPRFHILERDEGWDFILREQQLSLSDLADPRSARLIGRLLPAELMLMSSVMDHDTGLTVLAKVVDARDGRLLFSDDVFAQPEADELAHHLRGLALKIEQRFPLVGGHITKVTGATAQVDVGQRHGVQPFTRFVVLPGGGDKDAAPVYRAGEALVQLAVSRIAEQTGWAEIMPDAANTLVREGDYIHAR